MAVEEKKPAVEPEVKPEGVTPASTPAPNPGPSAEELRKQNEELQKQLKEKDTKISDLETTRATIEARERQVKEDELRKTADKDLEFRLNKINERRAYDPQGADADFAVLLKEERERAVKDAEARAEAKITQKTFIETLRNGVKSANPDFDDEVIDVIMNNANRLAATGSYKTPEDAVKAATDYVKTKFDNYAKKKNAVPPLPEGAKAEGGGGNTPPEKPETPKEKTLLEELEEANDARNKKAL